MQDCLTKSRGSANPTLKLNSDGRPSLFPNKPLISHGLEKDKKWIIIIPKRRKYGILKSQGIAPHFPF